MAGDTSATSLKRTVSTAPAPAANFRHDAAGRLAAWVVRRLLRTGQPVTVDTHRHSTYRWCGEMEVRNAVVTLAHRSGITVKTTPNSSPPEWWSERDLWDNAGRWVHPWAFSWTAERTGTCKSTAGPTAFERVPKREQFAP